MENKNNSNKRKIGILVNQIIDINKTYKNIITDYGKSHLMFFNDTYKDQTGTWIKTGFYQIKWTSDMDVNVGDKIKVTKIKGVSLGSFNNKSGIKQYVANVSIEAVKYESTYSNYGNDQYSSYGNYQDNNNNNNNYGNYGGYSDYNNNYGNYNGGNDDFGI